MRRSLWPIWAIIAIVELPLIYWAWRIGHTTVVEENLKTSATAVSANSQATAAKQMAKMSSSPTKSGAKRKKSKPPEMVLEKSTDGTLLPAPGPIINKETWQFAQKLRAERQVVKLPGPEIKFDLGELGTTQSDFKEEEPEEAEEDQAPEKPKQKEKKSEGQKSDWWPFDKKEEPKGFFARTGDRVKGIIGQKAKGFFLDLVPAILWALAGCLLAAFCLRNANLLGLGGQVVGIGIGFFVCLYGGALLRDNGVPPLIYVVVVILVFIYLMRSGYYLHMAAILAGSLALTRLGVPAWLIGLLGMGAFIGTQIWRRRPGVLGRLTRNLNRLDPRRLFRRNRGGGITP